jgi:hypothetical protein
VLKTCLLLLFVASLVAAAQTPIDQTEKTVKQKYRNLEVGRFTIEKDIDIPSDYFKALPQEAVSQLQVSKLFENVISSADVTTTTPPASATPVLRMDGVITAYHEGSRKGRYFGGVFNPGANTQIYAYVQYRDASTNALIAVTEVVGTLSGGIGGGDSRNVVHEFAESLVETTRFVLLKPVLAAANEPAEIAEDAVRETVELSESQFDVAQSKMNDLAAKGYRLADFKTTSYETAILVMAKVAETPKYQYLLYKAMLPTSVQKELTRRSSEGYRYRPHTMIMLKNHVFAIAERNSGAPAVRYEYRVHATMRESSAEKNIRDDQAEGFVLIDCRKTMETHHMLLLERKVENHS